MKQNYAIVSDSAMDLPYEFLKSNKIDIIPMNYSLNEKDFLSEGPYKEKSYRKLSDQIKKCKQATTSQVTIRNAFKCFEKHLKKGKDVLAIILSSALSGSFNSVRLAVRDLKERYPERKIYVIDSKGLGSGEGLLVWHAAKARKENVTIEENHSNLLKLCQKIEQWFTVDDITSIIKSGRLIDDKLNLNTKPIMTVDRKGKIALIYRKINRKASLRALVTCYFKYVDDLENLVIISHFEDEDAANFIKEEIIKKNPNAKILISQLGPILAVHGGVGSVAVFFTSNRNEK